MKLPFNEDNVWGFTLSRMIVFFCMLVVMAFTVDLVYSLAHKLVGFEMRARGTYMEPLIKL